MVKVLRWQAHLTGGGAWHCSILGAWPPLRFVWQDPEGILLALPEPASALGRMEWKVDSGGSGPLSGRDGEAQPRTQGTYLSRKADSVHSTVSTGSLRAQRVPSSGFGDEVMTSLPPFLETKPRTNTNLPPGFPLYLSCSSGDRSIWLHDCLLRKRSVNTYALWWDISKIQHTKCLFICFKNLPAKLHTNPHLGATLRHSFLLPAFLALLCFQPKFQETNIDRLPNSCQALCKALETHEWDTQSPWGATLWLRSRAPGRYVNSLPRPATSLSRPDLAEPAALPKVSDSKTLRICQPGVFLSLRDWAWLIQEESLPDQLWSLSRQSLISPGQVFFRLSAAH